MEYSMAHTTSVRGISLLICVFYITVPFAPVNIMATYRILKNHSIVTVTFNSSNTPSDLFAPEYYQLSVTPQPLAQPVTNYLPFVFNVTIHHYTVYNITITSIRCDEMNSSSINISSGKSCACHDVNHVVRAVYPVIV